MRQALWSIVGMALAASVATGQTARKPAPSARAQVSLAAEVAYQTPRADGARSCTCNELTRRLAGLRALVALASREVFARAYPTQARDLSRLRSELEIGIESAANSLEGSQGKAYADQERTCGQAVDALNRPWSQWQPFLAENGLDSDHYRGVKARNPAVPEEGDLDPDRTGRSCKQGQYWTEDRALWAINGREGVCAQERFEVRQVLAVEKGKPGHRCFEYELRSSPAPQD